MDVLILSKTHMNGGRCCVGGIATNGRYVRLLTAAGDNQLDTTELLPRQIWDIEFVERQGLIPPHIEDVLIQSQKLKRTLEPEEKVLDFVKKMNATVWEGEPDVLFDNMLKWTDNGSGYINNEAVPNHSVGFWIADKDLTKSIYYEKTRYNYRSSKGWRNVTYVGFDEAVEVIPAGTLIRVSLARWWDTKGNTEPRCSLQISGWYDLT